MTDPTRHPYRWVMLFGASLTYACFGALVAAMSVLVKPISESLELTPVEMGLVLGAWQFVYLFASIPTGALLDRFGVRPCLLVAGLILTGSTALRVFADSYEALLVAVLLFGFGGPLISVGAPKLVSRWFAGSERGLAMGIYMSSTGVGALLATIGTNSVVMPTVGHDWNAAFGVYTVIMLATVIVWAAIASRPISRLGGNSPSAGSSALNFAVFGRLLQSRQIRITMLMAVTMFFFIHGLNAWLPEILRAQGLTLIEASYWAGLPAIVAIGGALIITKFAIARRRMAILATVTLVAALSVLLLRVEPVTVLATCLIGLGIARSCIVPIALLSLMDADTSDPEAMGAASGLFFTAGQIGGMLAPILCGLVISATGNYSAALWLFATALFILLALIPAMQRADRSHSDNDPA